MNLFCNGQFGKVWSFGQRQLNAGSNDVMQVRGTSAVN